jgi:hypothetical protein
MPMGAAQPCRRAEHVRGTTIRAAGHREHYGACSIKRVQRPLGPPQISPCMHGSLWDSHRAGTLQPSARPGQARLCLISWVGGVREQGCTLFDQPVEHGIRDPGSRQGAASSVKACASQALQASRARLLGRGGSSRGEVASQSV